MQKSISNFNTKQADTRSQRDLLFEISEDLLCVAGSDGTFKQVNPAWTRCLGWSEAELLSTPVIEFVHPEDREHTLSGRENILLGEPLRAFENRYLCKDGSFRWLSWSSHPSKDGHSIFCIARDITNAKEMEQHLLYVNRMESMGALAAGIAHHLNNVLTPISMTLDLLLMHEQDKTHRKMIKVSQESLGRGIKLIQRLLIFSKPEPAQSGWVEVAPLLKSTLDLLEESIPPTIRIEQHLATDLPQLTGEFALLQQVLVDLLKNAIDAMPAGGTIEISSRALQLKKTELPSNPLVAAGTFVLLEIKDEGIGIDKKELPRIFEPFYTTKQPWKSTGLGLSTANTSIRNHGGFIKVESEPGAGCRVQVYLPVKSI